MATLKTNLEIGILYRNDFAFVKVLMLILMRIRGGYLVVTILKLLEPKVR